MTCLLNSYGQISKIDEILTYLKDIDSKFISNDSESKGMITE